MDRRHPQEAEHEAANAAVRFLQAVGLLTPNMQALSAGSSSSTRGRDNGGGGCTSVGSKRVKESEEEESGVPRRGWGWGCVCHQPVCHGLRHGGSWPAFQ